MGKEVKLSIRLKTEHLFEFQMYSTYYGFFGIISAGIILFSAILLIAGIGKEGTIQKILLTIIILVFLVAIPIFIYRRADEQLKASPIYETPLLYDISNEGIGINQGNHTLTNNWDEINKAVESIKSIILYSNKLGAFIFPKNELGEDYDLLKKIIMKNMRGKSCKLKW